jgi:hypothetical protein
VSSNLWCLDNQLFFQICQNASGKMISSIDGYIRYTPFIPAYLTPLYILYTLTDVMYVSICINTYQCILNAGVPILIWTDLYEFVVIFIHVVTENIL